VIQTKPKVNSEEKEAWSYSWGAHFSTSKIYKLNFEHIGPYFLLLNMEIKMHTQDQILFWLIANNRLNAKDMLLRKKLNSSTMASTAYVMTV
jgi:hypothetical protein